MTRNKQPVRPVPIYFDFDDNDLLVLESDRIISNEARHRIMRIVEGALAKPARRKVLVLDGGVRLKVIKRGANASATTNVESGNVSS